MRDSTHLVPTLSVKENQIVLFTSERGFVDLARLAASIILLTEI